MRIEFRRFLPGDTPLPSPGYGVFFRGKPESGFGELQGEDGHAVGFLKPQVTYPAKFKADAGEAEGRDK